VKVLVTGGAGFIGSHLVEALLERGDAVRVLDDFSTGSRRNLSAVLDRIELIEGDVCDSAVAAAAVAGMDGILHQAALPSVPRSFLDPVGTTSVNCGGILSVLEAARKAGVKRFVFASSSSVYGDVDLPVKQEGLPPSPISPYAVSKLSGEVFCRIYRKTYGMATVSLRYFNIFGPRQDPESQYAAVIPLFLTAALSGRSPVIYGDGTQSRDFTYVSNVVRANVAALSAPEAAWGKVCNVACGGETTLLELVERIGQLSGRAVEPEFAPPRPGDVLHSRADVSRARSLLDYSPEVSFADGLRLTYEYFSDLAKSSDNRMEVEDARPPA